MNLIIIIGIFILFVAWNIWWSSPQNIGKRGEWRVARKLDWLSKEYITLNDLLLSNLGLKPCNLLQLL